MITRLIQGRTEQWLGSQHPVQVFPFSVSVGTGTCAAWSGATAPPPPIWSVISRGPLLDPRWPNWRSSAIAPHPAVSKQGSTQNSVLTGLGSCSRRWPPYLLELCLHHKKIISHDYLLFLISFPLTLFCRSPLHSVLLLCDHHTPCLLTLAHTHTHTQRNS